MAFTPWEWQTDNLERFKQRLGEGQRIYVLEACMGSGKSAAAAMMARYLLDEDIVDHVIVLVPWKSIQGDGEKGMIAAFGRTMDLDTREKFFTGTRRQPFQKPPQMDATVTLYQEVCNSQAVELIEFWKREWGFRFAMICDEIHHTNEINGTWGAYVEQLKELAAVSVFMSGTYFRGDKKPIGCITLDTEGEPLKDYSYVYKRAVQDGVVRQVTTRHNDANITLFDSTANRRYEVLLSEIGGGKELSEAKKQVLAPDGECMRQMIQNVHDSLMRTRCKFPDAACLFVCRPGRSDSYGNEDHGSEDRHVHRIAKQIKLLTGEQPTVVTHKDRDAIGKLSAFRRSTSPYLVAINMVSEGCDIPRLRAVAFCRYTNSEMLFRQIAGRALRLHTENGAIEDTSQAAQIYIPAFPVLVQFASRLWAEADEGVQARRCVVCGSYPCECPCKTCGKQPCICIFEPRVETQQTIFGLDATPIWNGGHMADDYVSEFYVQAAQSVITTTDGHRHENPVQLGHAFQHFHRGWIESQTNGAAKHTPAHDSRDKVKRNMTRNVRQLAIRAYDKQFDMAYHEEIQKPFGERWSVISNTWSIERMQQINDRLERRIMETCRNG